jgi:signal transduction histidine kinase
MSDCFTVIWYETAGVEENPSGSPAKGKSQKAKLVVLGDRDRLHQIFINILANAVKFTPVSGQITVKQSLILVDRHPQAEVSITDTGMGINADFLPHVFERFLQAEKSGSAGGLGLGLAIAHHLVQLHQGQIHAESPGLGQGATFIVRLPLIKEG